MYLALFSSQAKVVYEDKALILLSSKIFINFLDVMPTFLWQIN